MQPIRLTAPRAEAPAQSLDLTPQVVDLKLMQGDDAHITLTVSDPDGGTIDLTGATPEAQIRASAASTSVLAAFTATLSGPDAIALHLPASEAAKLTAAGAVWDCQITVNGEVSTLCQGSVATVAEVTRP